MVGGPAWPSMLLAWTLSNKATPWPAGAAEGCEVPEVGLMCELQRWPDPVVGHHDQHGRLKARLRPMRGLKRHRSARILAPGHAFVRNLRRGHYDIATHVPARHQLRTAFDELAPTI